MFAFVRRIAKLFTSWSDTTPTQNMAATLSLEPVRRIRGGKRASLRGCRGSLAYRLFSRPALGAGLVASRQTFVRRCHAAGDERRARRPDAEPNRPPAAVVDQNDLPPSGIRSSRSGLRYSRVRSAHSGMPLRKVQFFGRSAMKEPDHRQRQLLRARNSGHAAAAPPSSVINSRRPCRTWEVPPFGITAWSACHRGGR